MPIASTPIDLRSVRELSHGLFYHCKNPSSSFKPLASSLKTLRNTLEDAEELFSELAEGPAITQLLHAVAECNEALNYLQKVIKEASASSCSDNEQDKQDVVRLLGIIDGAVQRLSDALVNLNPGSGCVEISLDTSPSFRRPSGSTYSPSTLPNNERQKDIVTKRFSSSTTSTSDRSSAYEDSMMTPMSQKLARVEHGLRQQNVSHGHHRDSHGWGTPFLSPDPLSTDIESASSMILRSDSTTIRDSSRRPSYDAAAHMHPTSSNTSRTNSYRSIEQDARRFTTDRKVQVGRQALDTQITSTSDQVRMSGTTFGQPSHAIPTRPHETLIPPSYSQLGTNSPQAHVEALRPTSIAEEPVESIRAIRQKAFPERPRYRVVNAEVQNSDEVAQSHKNHIASPSPDFLNLATAHVKSPEIQYIPYRDPLYPAENPPKFPGIIAQTANTNVTVKEQARPNHHSEPPSPRGVHVRDQQISRIKPSRYRRPAHISTKDIDVVLAFNPPIPNDRKGDGAGISKLDSKLVPGREEQGLPLQIFESAKPMLEDTDSTKEAYNLVTHFSDLEVDFNAYRQRTLIESWNKGHWNEAKTSIKSMLDDAGKKIDRPLMRKYLHLLGVIASLQGEWHEALERFILVLNSPLVEPSVMDAGDCAAAYWLGDTYAILGRKYEALMAFCIAEHGPLFQGSEGYHLHKCIRAEQAACQNSSSRSDFKLFLDRKMLKKEPTASGSIFDTGILSVNSANQFLESVSWPPEKLRLDQNQSRANNLRERHLQHGAWQEIYMLQLEDSLLESQAAWPMPFDPNFTMANVVNETMTVDDGDLITLTSSFRAAKTIPKAPAFSRMDHFTCPDLRWLILAVRQCLSSLQIEYFETPDSKPPGFAASYDTIESGIATKHSFSIVLFRPSLRPGYGVEVCPDGICSARIVRSEAKFDRGVHQDEARRMKKQIREYLDAARERQDLIDMHGTVMPVMGVNGASSSGMHRRAATVDRPIRSGSSSTMSSRPGSMAS